MTLPHNCFKKDQGLGRERAFRPQKRHSKCLKMEDPLPREWRGLYRVSEADLQKLNHPSPLLQRKAQRKMHKRSNVRSFHIRGMSTMSP